MVPGSARGERVDLHLSRVFPELSRSRLKGLLEEGAVTLGGRGLKAAMRLKGGEVLVLAVPEPRAVETLAQDLPLQILFQDRDLIVVNKAAGMVVHPAVGNWDGTMVNALLHQVKDLRGVGGELRPGIVHRLDKDTSGCMVVAKSEASLVALQKSFKDRAVTKTYLALVHGSPPDALRIETLFGRHPKDRKRFTGKVTSGKTALTELRTLERFDGAAWVEVALHTGRTHQIRVHLSEAGFPLFADAVYGSRRKPLGAAKEGQAVLGRQALHAWKLSFPHPRTDKPVAFEAPVPDDLERALAVLRHGAL